MKQFFWVCASLAFLTAGCSAFGVNVPPAGPAEFSGESAAAASSLWLILAGEGTWGAVLMAVLGVLWKFAKPYLDEWAARRKMDKLLLAVETGVTGCKALYTDEMKKANAGGRLTQDEVLYIRRKCREYIIDFMAAHGIDALKAYGPAVIDMLCEWMLARVKAPAAVKAAAVPLPDLAP